MFYALEEPGTETLRVPVLKVFDGDGFLTRIPDGQRGGEIELGVRFGFIDAPEMGQPGGAEAKEFLSSIIGGRWLDLAILLKMDTGRVVDRHQRIVAVPYLREEINDDDEPSSIIGTVIRSFTGPRYVSRNIELEMVLNGWAWVLDRYDPDERYFEALEDAQRHRRGIWARDDNVHPWDFKNEKRARSKGRSRGQPKQPSTSLEGRSDVRCPKDGCNGRLVLRSGRYGEFYGCSEFPECRYSRSRTD